MNLTELKEQVFKCKKCSLHITKKNYVFGEGSENAKIMFIGEAPGANEDNKGRPFIGRAGKILDELLGSINLDRGDVFICNILKCRPPNNRDPSITETEACISFLNSQINIINPKIICPMGNHAVRYILTKFGLKNKLEGISKLHGKVFNITTITNSIKIIPLYHPAVATYNPDMKTVLLKDFELLKGV